MIDFSTRATANEMMDNPALSKERLAAVYRDIDLSNRLLGGNKITLDALDQILRQGSTKSFTIIDLGCGNGSMLRTIAKYGKENSLDLRLIGIDLNQHSLQIAREASKGHDNIHYLQADILSEEQTALSCDILLCTLTLHHFSDKEIPIFLNKFKQMVKTAVIINDLQRSRWAYYLFKLFGAIFIKTKIAKNDGLVSIRRGFIRSELIALTQNLPAISHDIRWKWAFRYIWIMRRN